MSSQVLRKSKRSKKDIDEIVMLGGSSHIPKIRAMVQEIFLGMTPKISSRFNTMETVARGAAVQAAILSGTIGPLAEDLLLVDVSGVSFGLAIVKVTHMTHMTHMTHDVLSGPDAHHGHDVICEHDAPGVHDVICRLNARLIRVAINSNLP